MSQCFSVQLNLDLCVCMSAFVSVLLHSVTFFVCLLVSLTIYLFIDSSLSVPVMLGPLNEE